MTPRPRRLSACLALVLAAAAASAGAQPPSPGTTTPAAPAPTPAPSAPGAPSASPAATPTPSTAPTPEPRSDSGSTGSAAGVASPSAGRCSKLAWVGGAACICDASAAGAAVRLDGSQELAATARDGRVEVTLPPSLAPGEHALAWGSASGERSCRLAVATLAVEAGRTDLLRGQSTAVRFTVTGTTEPVGIRVQNRTPAIVSLEGGDEQTVRTAGGAANQATLTVRGLTSGSFDLGYAVVEEPCPCGDATAPQEEGEPQPEPPGGAPPPSPPASGGTAADPASPPPGGGERGAAKPSTRPGPCPPVDVGGEAGEDPLAPFYANPSEAAARQALRQEIAEAERTLAYWRRVCERGAAELRLAEENARRLSALRAELEALARRLGVALPTACDAEACCARTPCCAGLDPSLAADRAAFLASYRCLVDRFRTTNRAMAEAGSDFSWLLERWEAGADHRAMMGFYDQLFSAVHEVIDALTTSLGDRAKAILEEQLTAAGCSALGLTDDACRQARDAIQNAKDAKAAVDTAGQLMRAGALPPAFIVQMVDAMAQAAGNAARVAVEGWARFRVEMGATLAAEYQQLLCLEEITRALAALSRDCPRFCVATADALQAENVARRRALAAQDQASREAAAARLREQTAQRIDPAFAAATPRDDAGWVRACCAQGKGSYTVQVPGAAGPLAACARELDARLAARLGALWCHLWDVTVTVECTPRGAASKVSWEYAIDARRRPDCCPPR